MRKMKENKNRNMRELTTKNAKIYTMKVFCRILAMRNKKAKCPLHGHISRNN